MVSRWEQEVALAPDPLGIGQGLELAVQGAVEGGPVGVRDLDVVGGGSAAIIGGAVEQRNAVEARGDVAALGTNGHLHGRQVRQDADARLAARDRSEAPAPVGREGHDVDLRAGRQPVDVLGQVLS